MEKNNKERKKKKKKINEELQKNVFKKNYLYKYRI